MFTSIKRIVRSGFIGFWRNAFVSLSAIFVITVTLLVVGAMMLSSVLLRTTLTQIQEKVDINVYMVTSAEESRVLALKTSLEALPEVAEVVYTSRADALAQFTEKHKDDELTMQALDELGENPLGASLSIRAKETSQYEGIATFLNERHSAESPDAPLIDRINYNQNKVAIEKLTNITHTVERVGFFTMIILIISSVLIAFNTIRLAIYTAREEIGIMRLVGASNMFIRGPFILQGVMYGFISGVVTLLILYPVVYWLGPKTETFFLFNIYVYFVQNFGHLFTIIVGAGVVLGVISSTLAIARHLRV